MERLHHVSNNHDPIVDRDHEGAVDGHDALNDERLAFAERVRAMFEGTKTVLDELRYIHHEEGASERFNDLLNEIAYKALEEHGEFTANIRELKSGASQQRRLEIRDRQRALLAEARMVAMEAADISTEAGLSAIELGKKMVRERLEASSDEINSPNDVLKALGVLQQDENDERPRFVYPEGLFPQEVDKKWQRYLGTVRRHIQVSRDLASGVVSRHEVVDADSMRRIAHNSVTRDVHTILGFDTLPEETWDFEKTRNLLAKMRDERYPNIATAEEDVTATAMSKSLGVMALGVLSGRLSQMREADKSQK